MGTWHLELLRTDFEGFLDIVMYQVVVLHYCICGGRKLLAESRFTFVDSADDWQRLATLSLSNYDP